MKSRRLSTKEKPTSKRNLAVRRTVKEAFPGMRSSIHGEYPYSRVATLLSLELEAYERKRIARLKIDVFVKDYYIAIEVMGEQHYAPVAFGGDVGIARQKFVEQKERDRLKRSIAERSHGNFKLIELPFYIDLPNAVGWLSIIHQVAVLGGDAVYRIEESNIVPIDESGEPRINGKTFVK